MYLSFLDVNVSGEIIYIPRYLVTSAEGTSARYKWGLIFIARSTCMISALRNQFFFFACFPWNERDKAIFLSHIKHDVTLESYSNQNEYCFFETFLCCVGMLQWHSYGSKRKMMNRPGYSDGFATPLTVCGEFSSLYVTTCNVHRDDIFVQIHVYPVYTVLQ